MKNDTMCYLRERGGILLLYRNGGKEDLHNGFYVPPGGGIKPGEIGIEGIIREFKEETGLKLMNPKLKFIVTFDNTGRLLGGRTDREDHLVQTYVASIYNGDLKVEKGKNAYPVWLPESDLLRANSKIKMYPGDRELLKLIDREGVFEVLQQYRWESLTRFKYERVD